MRRIIRIPWNYLRHVVKHRWLVFLECCKLGIVWRGLTHDLSVFNPVEWFCCANRSHALKEDFLVAQLHHYHCNDHHWHHWVFNDAGDETLIPMSMGALKEMVADWRARAIIEDTSAVRWYIRHKDNIKLHPYTRNHVELLLGLWSVSKQLISDDDTEEI